MTDTARKGDWRGPINQILYGIQFTSTLDSTMASQMAEAMVARRYFRDGPQLYLQAIRSSRTYAGPLNDEIETPHSEDAIRSFLALVADQLEKLQTRSGSKQVSTDPARSSGEQHSGNGS
jgi:hypothetical protein